MKKYISLLLALILSLALCVPMLADETDPLTPPVKPTSGTVTIENATEGVDYAGYKLFDVTYSGSNMSYTIKDSSPFFAYVSGTTKLTYLPAGSAEDAVASAQASPFTVAKTTQVDASGAYTYNVTMASGLTDAKVIEWLQQLKVQVICAEGSTFTADLAKQTAESKEVQWTDVPFGYYLISSGLGAAITVDTNTPNVTIIDKNQVPEGFTKSVDDENIEIGQTATFTITFDKAYNYDGDKIITNYTIEDNMPIGKMVLTSAPVVKVTNIDGNTVTTLVAGTDYTLTGGAVGDDSFTISIPWAKNDAPIYNYDKPATITVTYGAKLLAAAYIDGQGNTNNATITWTPKNGTPKEKTTEKTVYTYALALKKVDTAGQPLADAKFTLKKGTADMKFSEVSIATDTTSANIYVVDPAGNVTELVSPKSGLIIVKGLDNVDYILTEIEAPEGYNLLTAPETVKPVKASATTTSETVYLDENGAVTSVDKKVSEVLFELSDISATVKVIVNKTGLELPSTGGIGTTIFYAVGGALMAGAVILLITKKKMSNEE